MNKIPQWITAIASSIGCIAIALAVWEIKVDHDQRRREMSLNAIREFDHVRTENTFRYFNFIFSLAEDDLKAIYEEKPIKVGKETVEKYFKGLIHNDSVDEITIDATTVKKIRYEIVSMLNALEVIALAYVHSVGDREIIDDAFYNLLIEEKFIQKCGNFMEYFGNSWPSVQDLPALMKPPKDRPPPA